MGVQKLKRAKSVDLITYALLFIAFMLACPVILFFGLLAFIYMVYLWLKDKEG